MKICLFAYLEENLEDTKQKGSPTATSHPIFFKPIICIIYLLWWTLFQDQQFSTSVHATYYKQKNGLWICGITLSHRTSLPQVLIYFVGLKCESCKTLKND